MVINANQLDQVNKQAQNEQAENSTVAQELRKIDELRKSQDKTQAKAYDNLVQDAKKLESLRSEKIYHKAQKDPGVKILSDLASDLAKLGIDLAPRAATKFTSGKLEQDIEQLANKAGLKEDKFEAHHNLIKNAVKRSDEHSQKQEQQQRKEDARQMLNSADTKKTLQDYSGAYAQYAVAASPEARQKLEDAQDKLRKKGFSEKEIIALERSVNRSFRTSFVADIQDSFIQQMFSPKNTFESIVTSRKLNNSYRQAVESEKASGISGDKDAVKEEMGRIRAQSKAEIKDYLRDAVESKLMERHLSGRDNKQEVKKLVELGYKVGFNFVTFLKSWEQKKVDLGMVIMEIEGINKPKAAEGVQIDGISSGEVGDNNGYAMTPEEEKELLINKIRAEFMKQAITGDPFAKFSFIPKIRKLKNGLIKLGLVSDDFTKIEKEARVLARYRTLEMLREAFIERATYYELSGPAYSVLKSRIKGLIANLKDLGMDLSKDELDMVRDEANRMMHDHTIMELNSAVAVCQNSQNETLMKNIPLMVKLVARLREESGFQHEMGENIDPSGLNGVKEHA